MTRLLVTSLQAALLLSATAQIPAFPGAEGFGAFSNGGRGGDVYIVTNLNASGAGSFADAIATVPSAGRTIVFAVSGYIRFPGGSGGFRLTKPKVTIAGQTAPGDGIGFYNNFFRVSGSDVVMRHIRIRHGKGGSGGDCLNLDGGANRSMIDHVALQFSKDENMSSFNSAPDRITFQNSINAWGLQSHSAGGLWDMNYATSIGNLFAHNHTRNPKARPVGLLDWFNNVTYDWNIGFIMGDSATPIDWKSNVIGNYFLCPPGNLRSRALEKANLDRNGKPNFTLHVANNLFDNNGNQILDGTDRGYGIASGSYATSVNRMTATGGTTINLVAPRLAFKKVVSSAGPLRLNALAGVPLRDEVDTHLFDNLLNFHRNIIARESDLPVSNSGFGTLNSAAAPIDTDKDGMPDNYETSLGWNPATKDHNTALASSGGVISGTTFLPPGSPAGYTRLEEYLHFLASPHVFVARNTASEPSSVTVDLSRYTLGFNSLSPVFTLTNLINGSATQSGPGGRNVTFTPAPNHVGRARFEFTVTDSQGDSWTQSFLALVASSGLPRSLVWKGGVSGNTWNTSALNWTRNDGTTVAFASGDNALFDDRGSATPAINIPSNVSTGALTFDTTKDYTLAGNGGLIIGGSLTKGGPGELTLDNATANTFSNLVHEAGSLVVKRPIDNGTAPLRLEGGSLTLSPVGGHIFSPLEINEPTTINVTTQHDNRGDWSGSGDVTINTTAMWTIYGSWNDYSGRMSFGPTASFRLNGTSNTNFGSPNLAIDLGTGSTSFYNRNGGLTVGIGTLTGGPNTKLLGGSSGTATSIYSIGARNEDATFQGSILNGTAGGNTAVTQITKVGTGEWTLTGNSSHTGSTTISNGSIRLNGSFANSPLIVNNTTTLAGSGSSGALVTLNSGGKLAPDASEGSPGTFTSSGGLTAANGSTLVFDLGVSPAESSDRVTVSSGTTTLSGMVNFQLNFLDPSQGVAAGTYPLINGGSTLSVSGLTMNPVLPAAAGTTRQTFSLSRPASGSTPAFVNLNVIGNAALLVWSGASGGSWNLNNAANFSGGPTNTFFNLDRVTFDDSAAGGTVNLAGTFQPSLVTVNNTNKSYTFGNSGVLSGAMSLVKNGGGTLNFANTSAYNHTGGLELHEGTIVLTSATSPFGSGPIRIHGGTLVFPPATASFANPMIFSGSPALSATGNVNLLSNTTGAMTSIGNAHVDLSGVSSMLTLGGPMVGFAGSLDFGGGGGTLRLNGPGSTNANFGSAGTLFDLGSGSGVLCNRNGDIAIELGALSGGPATRLRGRQSGSGETESVYRIGALGSSTTFAGAIDSWGDLSGLQLVKTGAGNLTLSGDSELTGGIAVESGTLTISGETLASGGVSVEAGGVLALESGSIGVQNSSVAGTISGHGTVLGDLNALGGTIRGRGHQGGTPGILTATGNLFLDESSQLQLLVGASSDRIEVEGDLKLAGTLQIALSPGSGFGRHTLATYGGALETENLVLAGIPAETTAHLSFTIPGQVDLVIDDSDEDGLPDSWELEHFGTLDQGPDDDPDGDGQSNAVELLAGTNPASGASFFSSTVAAADAEGFTLEWPSVPGRSYLVKTSESPAGPWLNHATVPSAAAPASRTSLTVSPVGPVRFYKVMIEP